MEGLKLEFIDSINSLLIAFIAKPTWVYTIKMVQLGDAEIMMTKDEMQQEIILDFHLHNNKSLYIYEKLYIPNSS